MGMSATAPTQKDITDKIVADARSLPALANAAKTSDPALYSALTGGYANHAWWPIALSAVSWVSAHYVLGWDPGTCAFIAGGLGAAGTYAYTWIIKRISPHQA